MTTPDWYGIGAAHCWHPYSQMKTADAPLAVRRTEGCRIVLEDGRELIDGIASWWSACHGYNHPHIIQAIQKQLNIMPHVMFGGLAHEQAYRLSARLAALCPGENNRVFFGDSGSVAVEIAMKMALQYWKNTGHNGKDRFLCFSRGYHGDTFGAMSVSDPERSMHKAFRHSVTHQFVVDIPSDEYALAEFEQLLAEAKKELAAIIIEPLVQGAGGLRFHSADILAEIYRLCQTHNVLFIADEIATGFGRTGNMFACNEAGITPDILCLGKALTGGALTLGATVASEKVFSAFYNDDPDAALMHGPTFMANALACAAANASLDLFETEPRLAQVEAIERQLHEELAPCRNSDTVVDVRVKGAIGVVQLASDIDVYALRSRFAEKNVWIRPIEDVIYVMPAFTITQDELGTLTQSIKEVIQEMT